MRPRPPSWAALRPPGWALAVFATALAARLGFLFLVDQPLLYSHQYTYFTSALHIAEHPQPLAYVLRSDDWRTWDGLWTIAPLYYLFAAAVLRGCGPHLLPLQLLQCGLDALVAVGVAALGRRFAGRWGALAGAVYALYWPALEMSSSTMTENLHTVLLLGGVLGLATEPLRSRPAGVFASGVLLGLSALTRSVTSAYLAILVPLRLFEERGRRGLLLAATLAAGAGVVVGPWIARNVALGEPPTIETAAYENIWWAHRFGDNERFRRQQEVVRGLADPAERRAAALRFALRSIQRRPDLFAGKVWDNFWHFLRPDWLDGQVRVEQPLARWQWITGMVSEDLVLLLTLPPFLVFLAAGPASPARRLVLIWTAYYLVMIVVVFHNELRYRSALVPFAFAGAAGGLRLLWDARQRRRPLLWVAFAVGVGLSYWTAWRYLPHAWRLVTALRGMAPALDAAGRGALDEARRATEAVAAQVPRSPRPWRALGGRLARAGHVDAAIEAYRRAAATPKPGGWIATVALARLGAQAAHGDAARWLREADTLSWATDPWVVLDAAWRELPAPRAEAIDVGRADYGAVRGFFHPRGGDPELPRRFRAWALYEGPGPIPPPGTHRWSRHRAWLRLAPRVEAPDYEVTLWMGTPFPSPRSSTEVSVRVVGGDRVQRFALGPSVQPYRFVAARPPDGVLVVQLDAPTWCRSGEPAEQGVRVDRMEVSPRPTAAGTPPASGGR